MIPLDTCFALGYSTPNIVAMLKTGGELVVEISLRGRGGQGVVMASQMLGFAFFKAGLYPQCYSLFGGERRGAPVVSFLRVDEEKILLKCDIRLPDEMIFVDSSLIGRENIKSLVKPGGKILINTGRAGNGEFSFLSEYTIGTVNATHIAEELGLARVMNTILLGAYARFTGHISLDHVIEAVKEMVPGKKEENIEAVRKGYEQLEILRR